MRSRQMRRAKREGEDKRIEKMFARGTRLTLLDEGREGNQRQDTPQIRLSQVLKMSEFSEEGGGGGGADEANRARLV